MVIPIIGTVAFGVLSFDRAPFLSGQFPQSLAFSPVVGGLGRPAAGLNFPRQDREKAESNAFGFARVWK